MFVEIRNEKGGKKYYLVRSYRRNKRVRKARVYLGLNLSQSRLEEKRKAAEPAVTRKAEGGDPYRTVLASSEINSLRSLKPGGRIKLAHLSDEEWLKFTEAFTYDTNAIEGSTVDRPEVRNIIEKGKWPEKPREEISETYGVADAVKYLRGTRAHLSISLIKELHRLVFRNSKSFAGRLRSLGQEVGVVDSHGNVVHRGAFSGQVGQLLAELVAWYKKNKERYPPLVLAAVVHNQFENIHPFADGNGRVGRLLLVNILIKHKLPPVNIELRNRQEYYLALKEYQDHGAIRPMLKLLLKEYRRLKGVIGR